LKTKFMLGAIVVAVLAVFGVIGLQQTKTTEAANITGITGCNGTIIAIGGTCDFTITFFDDWSAVSGVQATATGGNLSTVSTTCAATMTITGSGTPQIFANTDGILATHCDVNATAEQYTWVIRYTCTTVSTGVGNPILVNAPLVAGAGASVGSLSPGLPLVGAVPGINVQCVLTLPAGNSTIAIRKIDQFGQPLAASFSIQAGPFWTEVVRLNLGPNITQNPCDTNGTQGSWNFNNTVPAQVGYPAVQYGTSCNQVGVVTPNIFPTGLPAGQYRVVEVAGPNSYCTLV